MSGERAKFVMTQEAGKAISPKTHEFKDFSCVGTGKQHLLQLNR